MELPHLGTQCAESSCRQLDFLPFTCNLCKKEFCVDHHKYEAHNCTESYRADVKVPICPLCDQPVPSKRGQPPDLAVNDHMENNCKSKKKKIYTNKCSASGCKTKEMVPVTCDACEQNFCLRHRHTTDHDCKGRKTAREKAAEAAALRSSNKAKRHSGSSSRSQNNSNNSSQQSIRKYFTPSSGGPRPTGNVQPTRAANVSAIQGGMSEDEALARAMAASMQDMNGSVGGQPPPGTQEDQDTILARAIAASLEQSTGPNDRQQRNSNSCNVC